MDRVSVGLLGCGVVGGGVAERLLPQATLCGVPIALRRALVRSLEKKREPADVRPHLTLVADEVIADPLVDVVVECLGGVHPAFAYVERALRGGKHVITANKALVAEHGAALRMLARERRVAFRYDAAVGGATPMLQTIERLARTDEIEEVAGVVNGTTNFILNAMEGGRSFEDALAQAQRAGFCEADWAIDVDGIDAAHKLTILIAAAFGTWLPWDSIERRGIRSMRPSDVKLAHQLGCRVKLIARARREQDTIRATVSPELVAVDHPFASTVGAQNMIRAACKYAGAIVIGGLGAGRHQTASAVIADLAEIVLVIPRELAAATEGVNA